MSQPEVLICGSGIAGNALAFWLSKLNHNTTVIERSPNLRATGLQVNLHGSGIEFLRLMGLEEAYPARSVPEQGLRLVYQHGRGWGYLPANRTGRGLQNFMTDWEFMRGEGGFCEFLHGVSVGRDTRSVFGVWVLGMKRVDGDGDGDSGVEVVFSDGSVDRFDLVVGGGLAGVSYAEDDARGR